MPNIKNKVLSLCSNYFSKFLAEAARIRETVEHAHPHFQECRIPLVPTLA